MRSLLFNTTLIGVHLFLFWSVQIASGDSGSTRAEQRGLNAFGDAPATRFKQPLAQAVDLAPGLSDHCLQEHRLESMVRFWLGRSWAPADMRVVVRPSQDHPHGVTIQIIREQERRERLFDPLPETCSEALAVLGLAIALALDADALQSLTEIEQESSAESRAALFSAQIGGGTRVLPGLSFGLHTGVEVQWLAWLSGRVNLFSHYSPDNRLGPTEGRYDAAVFAASAQSCMGGRAIEALRLALCVGPAVGALHVRGEDYAISNSDTGLWITAVGTLRTELLLAINWLIDVDIVVPIYVPSIRVERGSDPDRVRQLDVAGVLISLGPGFDL